MNNIFDFDQNMPDYQDFRKKYNATTVLLDGVPHNCRPAENHVEFSRICKAPPGWKHPDGFSVPIQKADPYQFTLQAWLPDGQWVYDQRGLLVYVHQMPARQWRRSYCQDNYAMLAPYATFRQRNTIDASVIIQQMFSPPAHIELTPQAIYKIPDKYSGAPISPELAVSRYDENTWALITRTGVVGFINPSKSIIYISKISQQEIEDVIRGVHKWTISGI